MPTSDLPKCPNCRALWLPGATACPFCEYEIDKPDDASPQTSDSTVEYPQPRPSPRRKPSRSPGAPPPAGDSIVWTSKTGQVYERFSIPPSGIVRIGRASDSDVQLRAKLISRQHARIEWDDAAYYIRDAGSTNGTSLNDQLVGPTPARLNYGDQVQVGHEYLFLLAVGQPVPTPTEFPEGFDDDRIDKSSSRGRVRAGERIDNYRLVREIGRGGISVVYEAADEQDGTTVALKLPKTAQIHDPALVDTFEHEYRISRDYLSHENIITIYRLGHYEDNIPYIVMEYVPDGWSVYRRLRETNGPLPIRECQNTLIQTCRALSHAHQQDVIHRDIKPGNILLTPTHQVKLCDFGIARLGFVREFGRRVGTYKYMSPEQVRGDDIDVQSDIYSLGAVMYEMYTGRPPFAGSSDDIMEGHLNRVPKPPHQLNPQMPEAVERAILRALEKHPNDRYLDIEEMLDEVGWDEVDTQIRGEHIRQPQRMPEDIGAFLKVLNGPFAGRTIPIDDVSFRIFRGNINPLDSTISREHHAWIYLSGGRYWLEDLEAKNKSIHQKEVIDGPTPLRDGDIFVIGETRVRYRSRD